VINFVNDYLNGKAARHNKSQEAPSEDTNLVKTIVHSNFEKIVFDESKDVVVFIHAPTEAQSIEVLPYFEKLAEQVKSVEGLVFGKFDMTENEHDHIRELIFPRLMFYGKSNKHPDPAIALEPKAETYKMIPQFRNWLGQHSEAFRKVFPNESDDIMDEL